MSFMCSEWPIVNPAGSQRQSLFHDYCSDRTPSLNALQFLDTLLTCEGSVSEGDLVGMREPHFLLKKV